MTLSTPPSLSNSPMTGEPPSSRNVVVAGVNWSNAFEFTHLFRGFRLAINPAKILVALLAILLIYTAGRIFDSAWGPQVYSGEIESFQSEKPEVYRRLRDERLEARDATLRSLLVYAAAKDQTLTTERIDALMKNPAAAFRTLRASYEKEFQDGLADIHQRRLTAEANPDKSNWANDPRTPAQVEQEDRATASKKLYSDVQEAKRTVGLGIFDSFLTYEMRQFDLLVDNTLSFVRVVPVHTSSPDADIEGQAVSGGLISKSPDRLWRSDTVVGCIVNMAITGPEWLFSGTAPTQWRPENADTWGGWLKMVAYRSLYFASLTLFALFSLVLLALTGAIVTRFSALELSGAQRVSLSEVFSFALQRLWIFVKAPITPFLILLAIGVAMAIGGVMGAIPFIGPILLGMLFFVFIAIGFVVMLLLLGILGGFNLLYPTIAVEGSDAFDAMSRSFAYVYARPWRLLFYSVLSLIYGVITFLFVSFAVYLLLAIIHTFAGWGTNFLGYNFGAMSGLPKLDTLWQFPQFGQLIGGPNWYAMSWSEYIGALFLQFWVYMLITSIGAYVVSYYFSTHTIIYLLLRRSVDGQAITEVFVEDEPVTPTPTPMT